MRFPWTKKPEPEVEVVTLDEAVAAWPLWLAAGRPPFEWFMALDPDVQEALAEIGMRFTEARDLEAATCRSNPDLAEAAVAATDDPTDTAATASVLQHVLAAAADRMMGGGGASTQPVAAPEQAPAGPTWEGLARNQEAAAIRLRGQQVERQERSAVTMPGGDA